MPYVLLCISIKHEIKTNSRLDERVFLLSPLKGCTMFLMDFNAQFGIYKKCEIYEPYPVAFSYSKKGFIENLDSNFSTSSESEDPGFDGKYSFTS